MSVKREIAAIFRDVGHLNEFCYYLYGLGFRRAEQGIRKKVFVSKRHNFVVKLSRPDIEYYPAKGSKIGKFYLWPSRGGSRTFRRCRWHLLFQPKCDTRHQRRTFFRLEDELSKANTSWRCDAHDGNVALYRGKPVIIDY